MTESASPAILAARDVETAAPARVLLLRRLLRNKNIVIGATLFALLLAAALLPFRYLALPLLLFQSFLHAHFAQGDGFLHRLGFFKLLKAGFDLGKEHTDPLGVAAEIMIAVTGR